MQKVVYWHLANGGIVNGKERHGHAALLFDLPVFQRALMERLRDYQENGACLPFPKWFAEQEAAGVFGIDVTPHDWPEIKTIVAKLLEDSPVAAFCFPCMREYSQRQISRRKWKDRIPFQQRVHDLVHQIFRLKRQERISVDLRSGRQFLCPHGHEIMFTLDCIS